MKMLIDSQEIAKALQSLKPRRIAVAYVGKDWESLIPKEFLQEIIVAPTVGSNPKAIRGLNKHLGTWDKVHLLDNLHAKFYLSDSAAIVTSANLSRNALGMSGLEEVGMWVDDELELLALQNRFDQLKAMASARYRTDEEKEARLKQAEEDRERALKELEKYQVDDVYVKALDKAQKDARIVDIIESILETRASRAAIVEGAQIFYSDLAIEVNRAMNEDVIPTTGSQLGSTLGPLLELLNDRTRADGRPFLTALVVRKDTGVPGQGFPLGIPGPWTKELKKLFKRYHVR